MASKNIGCKNKRYVIVYIAYSLEIKVNYMHIPPLLTELIIIFLISIIVNIVCNKVRIPATVGFLLTGVLCGPSMLGVVNDMDSINILSELGVALLLFTIGMELSGDALARLKKPLLIGGSLQIGLTIVAVIIIYSILLNQKLTIAVFAGCLIALSSSAIVLRFLQQKGTTNTPTGRLTLAILVFQDIMIAPMLLMIPLLSGQIEPTFSDALWTIGKVVVVFGAVLLFVQFGLNHVMAAIVRTRVSELLLLSTLVFCMGLALLTTWLGLSLSLGAFLAGLFLARSEYSMNVISGILPYRDVFMSIFFISVGMLLDVDFLMHHIVAVSLITILFIFVKALLILPAVLIQKYPLKTAIIVALTLAQIGEFSFVLANEGFDAGLIDAFGYQNFLATSIITMLLTPVLIHFAPSIANGITKFLGKPHQDEVHSPQNEQALQNHLIIVGFGVSGQHLARAAKKCKIPYAILEMNPDTVKRYHDKEPIHYGDASRPAVLEHMGIANAKVIAIVISDPAAVQATVAETKKLNTNVRIVARTRFLAEVDILHKLGACDVIAEEFESSIEVFSQVLHQYMVPKQDIDALVDKIRTENYSMLRSVSHQSANMSTFLDNLPHVGVHALRLEEDAFLCGKNLIESELRQKHGVTVVAIHRNQEMIPSPEAQTILQPDDIIYVFGDENNLTQVYALVQNYSKKESEKE